MCSKGSNSCSAFVLICDSRTSSAHLGVIGYSEEGYLVHECLTQVSVEENVVVNLVHPIEKSAVENDNTWSELL